MAFSLAGESWRNNRAFGLGDGEMGLGELLCPAHGWGFHQHLIAARPLLGSKVAADLALRGGA